MKKEEVYVVLDTTKKVKRLYQILVNAKEPIYKESRKRWSSGRLIEYSGDIYDSACFVNNEWQFGGIGGKKKVSLDQLEEILLSSQNSNKEIKYQTVTREALGELYKKSCQVWMNKIDYYLNLNKFKNTVEIPNDLILKAYKEANTEQLKWLNKYLPKPKVKVTKTVVWYLNMYPDGDYRIHQTSENARKMALDKLERTVELVGTYEVEE